MSAPVQSSPTQSPTPSKSSLRRASGQNTSQRSLLPPPSPRFEDAALPVRYSPRSPPNQTLDYNSEEDALSDEEDPTQTGQEPYFTGDEHNLKRPFQPFFTLIEDTLTSEHHHPSVHYIFADDEHDIITEAALRSLEQDELEESSATAHTTHRDDFVLERTAPGVKEHYLILDVQPVLQSDVQSAIQADDSMPTTMRQGYVVSGVTSLSPDWQVQSSIISAAPTIGHSDDEAEDGLMLRISGRGYVPDDSDQKLLDEGNEKETVEEMIERLQQRIMEVKILMDADDADMQEHGVVADFEEQD